MVHVRLNETEPNPNPHVNFITALPSTNDVHEEARELLRALAAQVRPVMKSHGFSVNSLEEYEYNRVFAGRNWNHGETVELVLRMPGSAFYPSSWLMSTLCHELAHIKHMNHGPAFQALWARLRHEVRQLQERGYYGDGYWSSGQRLGDSARRHGDGIESGDFPEYMCGGAQQRTRPTAARRRRAGVPRGKRKETVPSLHTGRQTAVKRKAGARVTSKYAFAGEGSALGSVGGGEGSKGKRAASNRAREERALAAERRIQALLPAATAPTARDANEADDQGGSSDQESDVEIVNETDAERRQNLLFSKQEDDDPKFLGDGSGWKTFEDEFRFARLGDACDIPKTSGSMSTTGQTSQREKKGKMKDPLSHQARGGDQSSKEKVQAPWEKGGLGLGKLVQTEIDFRRKESLGMAPTKTPRTVGSSKPQGPSRHRNETSQWSCGICTLINENKSRACAACDTPRGQEQPES